MMIIIISVMMWLEAVCHRFNAQDIEEQSCRYLFNLYLVTILLWISSLIIGATSGDLRFVLGLSGSISYSALGYILPALVIIKVNGLWDNRKHLWNSRQFIVAFFTLGLGIVTMFAGTISTVLQKFYGEWYY